MKGESAKKISSRVTIRRDMSPELFDRLVTLHPSVRADYLRHLMMTGWGLLERSPVTEHRDRGSVTAEKATQVRDQADDGMGRDLLAGLGSHGS